MSKTAEQRKRRDRRPVDRPPVDGLTVGWMVTLITTFVCLSAVLALRAYVRFGHPGADAVRVFSGLLLFAAAVIGVVLLVLTPVVVRRKRSHPPKGIVCFALLCGAAPWLVMLWQGWE